MRDIAKNIRTLRTAKNLTQDELAEKLFVTRQTVSNYETGKSRPDVEMLARIADILETDVNSLIYGPQPTIPHPELKALIIGAALSGAAWVAYLILNPLARDYQGRTYNVGPVMFLIFWLRPLACLFTGWTLAQLMGMALKKKPFCGKFARQICIVLLAITVLWILLVLWSTGAIALNDWLFTHYLRGAWVEADGINVASHAWSKIPPPIPNWLGWLNDRVFFPMVRNWPYLLSLSGIGLWLTGFPLKKNNEKESC